MAGKTCQRTPPPLPHGIEYSSIRSFLLVLRGTSFERSCTRHGLVPPSTLDEAAGVCSSGALSTTN
jgi:hypothetical protein